MALPITGPVSTTLRLGITPQMTVYDSKRRYAQARPYTLNLPYFRSVRQFSAVKLSGSNPVVNSGFDANVIQSFRDAFAVRMDDERWVGARQDVANRARAKLVANLGATSQIATTLAEWQQTANMMGGKLSVIARSANALRKGNVAGAVLALSPTLPKTPRGSKYIGKWSKRMVRRSAINFSNAWLELHFGWVPLLQDVYGAMDFLQSQQPLGHAEGRATSKGEWVYVQPQYFPTYYTLWKGVHEIVWACRAGVDWKITNPNLFLANRLGILNPLSVAWELVPFSFVVDWFTNVGQFVAQFSDFAGLSLENPYYTDYGRDVCSSSMMSYRTSPPSLLQGNECVGRAMSVERKLGLPDVHLRIPPLKRVSIVRAATAIALLVQLGISRNN